LSEPGRDLAVMDELIVGSIDFLHGFVLHEAACYLQSEWEKQVMLEVRDISGQNVSQLLMGESGFARKFVEGPAGPFIERNVQKGYYPVIINEKSIAFDEAFLSYLNRGERAFRTAADTYNVVVQAEPAGANRDARISPHETILELKCNTGTTRLVNLNYPVSKSFAYSPQNCNDVTITINIGNLVLTKSYSGYLAFPQFIRDFENNDRRLYAEEFPEEEPALRRMGVEYISMAFEFIKHEPVLDFLSVAAEPVPEIIARCWD
jgi:type VI secretion system protein ImpL